MPTTKKPGKARDRLRDRWITVRLDEETKTYLDGLAKKWGGTVSPSRTADTVSKALQIAWESEGKPT